MKAKASGNFRAMLAAAALVGFRSVSWGDAESPAPSESPKLEGSLHCVGSDTMDVITFNWIQAFRQIHPNVHVTLEARSSLTAIPALTSGAADLGPIARTAPDEDIAAFVRKFGYRPYFVRVGCGAFDRNDHSHAIAIYVNGANPLTRMSLAQLDGIFSRDRRRGHKAIETWGDLGVTGSWATRPVIVYAVRRPNGIADAFQHLVLQDGPFLPSIHERGNSGELRVLEALVAAVAADPNGISYAGFQQATPTVKALSISADEDGPFVEGTLQTVRDGTYPLARYLYIAVNKPPGRPLAANIREFLRLVLNPRGQQIVAREGYFLPLPKEVAAQELAGIN